MIEKMKYVSIMGAESDLDRVIEKYIERYSIQLEYASKELYESEGLTAFSSSNPYGEQYHKAERFFDAVSETVETEITRERAFMVIDMAYDFVTKQGAEIQALTEKRGKLKELVEDLRHFENLLMPIEAFRKTDYITCKIGKMPYSGFLQFKAYLYDDNEILFEDYGSSDGYTWAVYFTPKSCAKRVESIFSSLHFESIDIPESFDDCAFIGKPDKVLKMIEPKLKETENKIKELEKASLDAMGISKEEMAAAYRYVRNLYHRYDCRKYAVRTSQSFYIFVGWMTEGDAAKLSKELEQDDKVILMLENINESILSKTPTKLRNPRIFKPFEFFVKMYGLPGYNEMDPTPFVALTYCLLFGMMFGDLGQGMVLSVAGYFLHRKKGYALGSIICVIGIFSMFFGLMYGSLFGFEDVLNAIWLRPSHDIMDILIVTVLFGISIILGSMLLGIINAAKQGRMGKLWFDANGIAGLIFYIAVIGLASVIFIGGVSIPVWLVVSLVSLPLLAIAFKEPLTSLIEHKPPNRHKGSSPVLLVLEAFMEIVEVLLGFFTNTVSFVRVGGFAIGHAALMAAVMMLSGADKGNINWLVIILGNIFVMGLEGLVVGIQVLRLEFYEMFSRYYTGDGKEFVDYKSIINN